MSSKSEQGRWWMKALAVALSIAAASLGATRALAQGAQRPAAQAADHGAAHAGVEVIFAGFAHRPDKGASIFVRLTGEVPVAVDLAGRRLTYRLGGAKLGVPNNGNPLPTDIFGPPVSHVALVPNAEGVDLVIDLSSDPDPSGPTHRMVTSDGLATLRVELPPAP